MSDSSYGALGATTAAFVLEVDGIEIGRFTSVSGLQVEVQVETYEEGGENGFVHKLPGRMTWPDLVFTAGLTDSDALFAWMSKTSGEGFAAAGNKLERTTAAVTVVDAAGQRLRSWNFEGAFPIRWSGPDLNADAAGLPREELVVAHHGFQSKNARA